MLTLGMLDKLKGHLGPLTLGMTPTPWAFVPKVNALQLLRSKSPLLRRLFPK
jgi:hypothetical protein